MAYTVDMVTGPAAMKEAATAICHAVTHVQEQWDSFNIGWTDKNNRNWVIESHGDNAVIASVVSREHPGKYDFSLLLPMEDNTRLGLLESLAGYIERMGLVDYVLTITDKLIQKDEPFNSSLFSSHGEYFYECCGDEMLHISCKQPRDEERFSLSIRYNVLDI